MMTHNEILSALLSLRPGAEFVIHGDALEGIEWIDKKQMRPTDDEIMATINVPALSTPVTAAVVDQGQADQHTAEDLGLTDKPKGA